MSFLQQEQVISSFQVISNSILLSKQEPLCCFVKKILTFCCILFRIPNNYLEWNKHSIFLSFLKCPVRCKMLTHPKGLFTICLYQIFVFLPLPLYCQTNMNILYTPINLGNPSLHIFLCMWVLFQHRILFFDCLLYYFSLKIFKQMTK